MTTTTERPIIETAYLDLVATGRKLREAEQSAAIAGDRLMARACDAAAIAVEQATREVRGHVAAVLAGYR